MKNNVKRNSIDTPRLLIIHSAIGWGSEFFRGRSSRVLQEAPVRIWSNSQCQTAWKGKRTILSSMVCAGGDNGKDSCQVIRFLDQLGVVNKYYKCQIIYISSDDKNCFEI